MPKKKSKQVTVQRAWLERLVHYGERLNEARDLCTEPIISSGSTSQEEIDDLLALRQMRIAGILAAASGYIESVKFILGKDAKES